MCKKFKNIHMFLGAVIISFMVFCAILLLAYSPLCADAKTVKVKLSAVGDCALYTLDSGKSPFEDYYKKYGPDYFFRKVKPVFLKDDITVINFEGTLTNATKRRIKDFNFKGPAKYAKIVKSGSIEVVNLANNHTMDYFSKGFHDTKKILRANNIPYCHKTTIAYKNVKGVKVAILGFDSVGSEHRRFNKRQLRSGIKRAKRQGAKIIVVNMHWGIEKRYLPNAYQRMMGRYAIDCGASVVIGHHPHVLQGIETYKGKCIVYSLGNFLFGGISNHYDKDTIIFQQTFYVKDGELVDRVVARVIPCMTSAEEQTNTCQPQILRARKKERVMSKIRALSFAIGGKIKENGAIARVKAS